MRYLIGALCAVALLFGGPSSRTAAATVGCGRVTTFVAPYGAGSLPSGDGWVIFAKPDGSSDKVILRAGTQVGTLSGYICIGREGVYSTGVIAPGAAGYVPEPAVFATPGTAVYCGTVAANSITTGQGSGPRTLELRVTSGPGGGGRFSVPESIALPTIGSYLCGQFAQGVPMNGLLTVLRAGDPASSPRAASQARAHPGRPVAQRPIFAGLIGPHMPGFVAEGTLPATATRPAPSGFVLPQACAFVAPPVVGTDSTKWAVDCGAQANHDACGTLGPVLTQQGWMGCAIGLGTMQVKKNGVMLGVQDSTLAPGEYPGLTQFARLTSPCT